MVQHFISTKKKKQTIKFINFLILEHPLTRTVTVGYLCCLHDLYDFLHAAEWNWVACSRLRDSEEK